MGPRFDGLNVEKGADLFSGCCLARLKATSAEGCQGILETFEADAEARQAIPMTNRRLRA